LFNRERFKKAMKRDAIKAFFVVVLIIIVLTLASLFLLQFDSMPTFNFLSGQNPLHHVKDRLYRIDFYSFKADVNDIYKIAKAELISLGYNNKTQSPQKNNFSKLRQWELPDNSVLITFRDNRRLKVFSDPQTSQYSSPDRYWDYPEDGWITVEIKKSHHNFWLWFYKLIW
jgi:hypothetical protein